MHGYKLHTFSGIGGGWPSESLLFSLSFFSIFPGSFSVSPSSSVPTNYKEVAVGFVVCLHTEATSAVETSLQKLKSAF